MEWHWTSIENNIHITTIKYSTLTSQTCNCDVIILNATEQKPGKLASSVKKISLQSTNFYIIRIMLSDVKRNESIKFFLLHLWFKKCNKKLGSWRNFIFQSAKLISKRIVSCLCLYKIYEVNKWQKKSQWLLLLVNLYCNH